MPAPRKYVDQAPPTDAQRQQATRERRRAAGLVRVEAWLAPAELQAVQAFAQAHGLTVAEALARVVRAQLCEP